MRLRVFLTAVLATAALDWLPRFLPGLGPRVGSAVLVGHALIAAIAAYWITVRGRPLSGAVVGWCAVMLPIVAISLAFVWSGRAARLRLGPAIMMTNLMVAALAALLGTLAGLVAAHLRLRRSAREPAARAA